MFRFLWIASWIGLLAMGLRALLATRSIIMSLSGGLDPAQLSIWQLGLMFFTLIAAVMLIVNLRGFGIKRPSKAHKGQLISMLVMIFWLWLFTAQA